MFNCQLTFQLVRYCRDSTPSTKSFNGGFTCSKRSGLRDIAALRHEDASMHRLVVDGQLRIGSELSHVFVD